MPIIGIIASGIVPGPNLYALESYTFTTLRSTDGISWTKITPNLNFYTSNSTYAPSTYYLNNQRVILVKENANGINGIFTSTNALTWTRVAANSNLYYDSPNKIQYLNNQYVYNYRWGLFTSTDLITWNAVPFASNIYAVAYGNSGYAAQGDIDNVTSSFNENYTSTNGITWTKRSSLPYGGRVMDVLYGDKFVSAGFSVQTDPTFAYIARLYTSTDGITWTSRSVPDQNRLMRSIAYNPSLTNKYVIATSQGTSGSSFRGYYSTDGTSWTNINVAGEGYYVTGAGSHHIMTLSGSQFFLTSTDAITWTQRTIPNSNSTTGYVSFDGTNYIFGLSNVAGTSVYITTNFTTWTTSGFSGNTNTMPNVNTLVYGNGNFVGISGSGRVTYSQDFTTWSNATVRANTVFRGLSYGNGTWVAVGDGGAISTSTDITTWTSRTSNTTNDLYVSLYVNGFTNKYIVAGQSNTLRTSTDGTTWTTRTFSSPNTALAGTTNGTNLAVIAGYDGFINTSTDGVTWTSRTSNTTREITSLAYLNNLYLYIANPNNTAPIIGTSTDGVTWTTRTNPLQNAGYVTIGDNNQKLTTMAYINNTYVVGTFQRNSGTTGYNADAAYITSTDGITWTSRTINQLTTWNIATNMVTA